MWIGRSGLTYQFSPPHQDMLRPGERGIDEDVTLRRVAPPARWLARPSGACPTRSCQARARARTATALGSCPRQGRAKIGSAWRHWSTNFEIGWTAHASACRELLRRAPRTPPPSASSIRSHCACRVSAVARRSRERLISLNRQQTIRFRRGGSQSSSARPRAIRQPQISAKGITSGREHRS